MTKLRLSATLLLSLAVFYGLTSADNPSAPRADIVVAPDGDDANPGTVDKPVASIAKAQKLVREKIANAGDDATGEIVVRLRGGTYRLTETLEFTPEDTGDGRFQVTY